MTRIGAVLMAFFIVSCGSSQNHDASNLQWEQSRSGDQRYAYLWPDDLKDEFVFGVSVINVEGFLSGALNASVSPRLVNLSINASRHGLKLNVKEKSRKLVSFDVKKINDRFEVDFASAGNDLTFKQLINTVGSDSTSSTSPGSRWRSSALPTVIKVEQDNHTVVVDLAYNVQQSTPTNSVADNSSGTVYLRLFLVRQKSLPRVDVNNQRYVNEAKKLSIGYFSPSLNETSRIERIQRFAYGKQETDKNIHFYLKNFPKEFEDAAKEAVLSWNVAFDDNPISVSIAPDSVDAGDPRHNVIKWFDNTDPSLGWAGVANMTVNPQTGLVMGGDVYVQGNSLLKKYQSVVDYALSIPSEPSQVRIEGTLGEAELHFQPGEFANVPFLSDVTQDYDSYMQGLYRDLIAHEVGHVLGLRHNFRGSVKLDTDKDAASVMDYLPDPRRSHYSKPGSYDIAAIRWGYYGEKPKSQLDFCTDEDLLSVWDCNMDDWGDPVEYALDSLNSSINLITLHPKPLERVAPISGSMKTMMKIWRLQSELPGSKKDTVLSRYPQSYAYLQQAKAAANLSAEEQAIVESNLEKMRQAATKAGFEIKPSR